MRSKELKELRKAFLNLKGSFDEVMKSSSSRGKKVSRKKVSVKNEDYDDEDIEDDVEDEDEADFEDEDIEDYSDEDLDAEDSGLDEEPDEESVVETAEAIVDMVESLPEEVTEEVKDQLLSDAADEVEEGVPTEDIVENVRRRVYNIRRRVNNARRARIKNARRLQNARRRRLFNASTAEGLSKAGAKYQNPMSKFQNARKRYAWNDDAGDLDAGLGDDWRDAEKGPSISGAGTPSDDGYGGDEDNNYWPGKKPSGKSAINTYNARIRRIINKARAYDALMNGLGCSGGDCDPGKVNLNNKEERDAYNAGVTQNGRYFLRNGRVYTFNDDGMPTPASTPAYDAAPAPPAPVDMGGEDEGAPTVQDGNLVIPLNPEDVAALAASAQQEAATDAAQGTGYDDMGAVPEAGTGPVPGGGGTLNARRRRVRNRRGYRSIYNQNTSAQVRVSEKRASAKPTEKSQETQVNNSVPETGLDIPSTFPSKAE